MKRWNYEYDVYLACPIKYWNYEYNVYLACPIKYWNYEYNVPVYLACPMVIRAGIINISVKSMQEQA
jgi:hypothetical protein